VRLRLRGSNYENRAGRNRAEIILAFCRNFPHEAGNVIETQEHAGEFKEP
jgi:hypothetical protein